jgi:hypothetical protein
LAWQQLAARRDDVGLFGRAETDLLESARRAPLDPFPRLRLARLYLLWAQRAGGSPDLLERAEVACQQVLTLGPYRASAWDMCAEVSRRRGRRDEAAARAERASHLRSILSP